LRFPLPLRSQKLYLLGLPLRVQPELPGDVIVLV
jgi:hypothetical protein